MTLANSGLPYPVHVSGNKAGQIELPGVPIGSFGMSTYDEISINLKPGDIIAFCSDGISETFNLAGEEFGSARVVETVREHKDKSAKEIVDAVFGAMREFRR